MEDIEVNTNFAKPTEINKPKGNNILFKPTFDKMELEENKANSQGVNQTSVLNRSSMMTYGKM